MPAHRKLPHVTVLRRMRAKEASLKEIGDLYGATPSAVWRKLNAAGEIPPARTIDEMTGWDIAAHHRNAGVMRHLMVHNRMELGKDVEPSQVLALRGWVEDMLDGGVVVDYHPEAPANDASSVGGFYYRVREAADDTFFRRHPEEQDNEA